VVNDAHRQVVELIRGLDGLTEGKVARQDDVLAPQRDNQGTLDGPGAYPGDGGELGHELVVRQGAQHLLVQPSVRHPFGQVAERADLPPRQAGLAELAGVDGQQFGGGGEMAAEQGLDAGQGPAGRRDGQLLAGDLEQQGAVQVHRRQLGHPRPRVEVRPVVDEPGQHRVSAAQVSARLWQRVHKTMIRGSQVKPHHRDQVTPGTHRSSLAVRASLRDRPSVAASQVRGLHRIPVMRAHLPDSDHGVMDPAPALYTIRINGHLGAMVLSAFPTMMPQRHGADTVLTGLLDRSALYGVLAEIDALGLDLLEVRQLEPGCASPEPGDGADAI